MISGVNMLLCLATSAQSLVVKDTFLTWELPNCDEKEGIKRVQSAPGCLQSCAAFATLPGERGSGKAKTLAVDTNAAQSWLEELEAIPEDDTPARPTEIVWPPTDGYMQIFPPNPIGPCSFRY